MQHVTYNVSEFIRERHDQLQVLFLTVCIVGVAWAFEQRRRGSAMCIVFFCLFYTAHVAYSPRLMPGLLRRWLGRPYEESECAEQSEDEASDDDDEDNGIGRQEARRTLRSRHGDRSLEGEGPLYEGSMCLPAAVSQCDMAEGDDVVKDCFSWQDPVYLAEPCQAYAAAPAQGTDAADADEDGGGAASDAAAGDAAYSVSKSRLDLIFRYMANAESKNSEQGTTLQRQKLQRKLLLRSVARTNQKEPNKDTSTGIESNCGDEENLPVQDALMDSGKMEELIRELGEPQPSNPPKSTAAKKAKGRKAYARKSSPARRPAESATPGSEEDPGTRVTVTVPAADVALMDSANADGGKDRGTGGGDAGASCNPDSLEALSDEADGCGDQSTEGFQVVAGGRRGFRRMRRQEQEITDVTAANVSPTTGANLTSGIAPIASPGMASNLSLGTAASRDCTNKRSRPIESAPVPGGGTASTQATHCPVADEEDAGLQESWEWQCPSGYRLEPHTCVKDMLCSACGLEQKQGASVLWSIITGWLACEECVRLAYDQPVEPAPHPGIADSAQYTPSSDRVYYDGARKQAPDPAKMSAVEIAKWFKQQGAEDVLRRCMLQVVSAKHVG